MGVDPHPAAATVGAADGLGVGELVPDEQPARIPVMQAAKNVRICAYYTAGPGDVPD
jgi:hypothetical protein